MNNEERKAQLAESINSLTTLLLEVLSTKATDVEALDWLAAITTTALQVALAPTDSKGRNPGSSFELLISETRMYLRSREPKSEHFPKYQRECEEKLENILQKAKGSQPTVSLHDVVEFISSHPQSAFVQTVALVLINLFREIEAINSMASSQLACDISSHCEKVYTWPTGSIWEAYASNSSFEIHIERDCNSFLGFPCKHCHSFSAKEPQSNDPIGWSRLHWKCPRVVVAFNDGGHATTGVCLDCLLEACKEIETHDQNRDQNPT